MRRVWEHKEKVIDGFTKKYGLDQLVYYEVFEDLMESIKRERAMKAWQRSWKIRLIEEKNSKWLDLYDEVCGSQPSLG